MNQRATTGLELPPHDEGLWIETSPGDLDVVDAIHPPPEHKVHRKVPIRPIVDEKEAATVGDEHEIGPIRSVSIVKELESAATLRDAVAIHDPACEAIL
jgi:hypothetical protein